jgi:hypothetical protein
MSVETAVASVETEVKKIETEVVAGAHEAVAKVEGAAKTVEIDVRGDVAKLRSEFDALVARIEKFNTTGRSTAI